MIFLIYLKKILYAKSSYLCEFLGENWFKMNTNLLIKNYWKHLMLAKSQEKIEKKKKKKMIGSMVFIKIYMMSFYGFKIKSLVYLYNRTIDIFWILKVVILFCRLRIAIFDNFSEKMRFFINLSTHYELKRRLIMTYFTGFSKYTLFSIKMNLLMLKPPLL